MESLAQHAVQSSADKSVVDEIAVLEFTRTRDGAKAIIDADPSTSQGRYVLDHPERVRTLLRKVLGGPVELDLRPRSGREAPRAVDKGVADAVAREDPLVKSVMELFDATIVEITARVAREDSLEASSASSDESVDQH